MTQTIQLATGNVYVHTRREGKCTALLLDFFVPREHLPTGYKLADQLGRLASARCFAAGRRKTIWSGSGPTVWSATVPTTDLPALLGALENLTHGNPAAAEDLLATWQAESIPAVTS